MATEVGGILSGGIVLKPTLKPTKMEKIESWLGVDKFNAALKLPTKQRFAIDHPEKIANPRITVDSAEFAELEKNLKPGDVILCGNDDSFVHGIVYLGNGEIVHSLAQEKPDRKPNWADSFFNGCEWLTGYLPMPKSWKESLAATIRTMPRSTSDGIGVIHEPLRTYFARANRDNIVLMRNPNLTEAQLANMKTFALAQVGKPYDFAFSTFDDSRMYCTELVAKTLARGGVQVKGMYGGAGPVQREMYLNEEIVQTKGLTPVWKSKSYEKTPFGQTHPVKIGG